jgi:hypothetical protein
MLNGTSVNVVVPKSEKEADRLVTDIKNCQFPNTQVLAVNMRFCRQAYPQFLLDLWQQFHPQPTEKGPDLFTILTELEQSKQQFIIVLNHLDAMSADDVDEHFNQDFYIHLNSLKNYRNVALLVITQNTSYHGMLFKIGNEFKTSKLDIQEIEYLPSLTSAEARTDLTRQHPELSTVHISHLLQQGQHQELGYDYALLDYLTRHLHNTVQSWDDMMQFIRQLDHWHAQYSSSPEQPGYIVLKKTGLMKKILILFNAKLLFQKTFIFLKVIFADPFIALIEFVKEWWKTRRK